MYSLRRNSHTPLPKKRIPVAQTPARAQKKQQLRDCGDRAAEQVLIPSHADGCINIAFGQKVIGHVQGELTSSNTIPIRKKIAIS
jgi:hypothetical protein